MIYYPETTAGEQFAYRVDCSYRVVYVYEEVLLEARRKKALWEQHQAFYKELFDARKLKTLYRLLRQARYTSDRKPEARVVANRRYTIHGRATEG